MKKLFWGTVLLSCLIVVPIPSMAGVSISIGIPLPPAVIFGGPIEVIVIPDTYLYDVYAIPDIDVDIYFCRGWWWRLWEGRWYRSRNYDRGWVYYRYIPDFYYDIDFRWRQYYRQRDWHGHRWDYQRIPYHQLQQNWRSWNSNRYWEKQKKWNVKKYQSLAPQRRKEIRRQRQFEYSRRPEVRKHEQWKREQPRQPQVRQPIQQPRQPQVRQPIQQQRQPQVRQPIQQRRQPQVRQPVQQRTQPQVQQPASPQPQRKPGGRR